MNRKTADFIISLISEEENQTEKIKKQNSIAFSNADVLDSSAIASEQSFNREQVQEQEQVNIIFSIA